MIQFKCWFCGRRYSRPSDQIGRRFTCSCKFTLRVPASDGGNCQVKSVTDWLVQIVVCGGGGALLGFGLGLLIASRLVIRSRYVTLTLFVVLPLVGLLAGVFGGERGLDWLGRHIRDREDR